MFTISVVNAQDTNDIIAENTTAADNIINVDDNSISTNDYSDYITNDNDDNIFIVNDDSDDVIDVTSNEVITNVCIDNNNITSVNNNFVSNDISTTSNFVHVFNSGNLNDIAGHFPRNIVHADSFTDSNNIAGFAGNISYVTSFDDSDNIAGGFASDIAYEDDRSDCDDVSSSYARNIARAFGFVDFNDVTGDDASNDDEINQDESENTAGDEASDVACIKKTNNPNNAGDDASNIGRTNNLNKLNTIAGRYASNILNAIDKEIIHDAAISTLYNYFSCCINDDELTKNHICDLSDDSSLTTNWIEESLNSNLCSLTNNGHIIDLLYSNNHIFMTSDVINDLTFRNYRLTSNNQCLFNCRKDNIEMNTYYVFENWYSDTGQIFNLSTQYCENYISCNIEIDDLSFNNEFDLKSKEYNDTVNIGSFNIIDTSIKEDVVDFNLLNANNILLASDGELAVDSEPISYSNTIPITEEDTSSECDANSVVNNVCGENGNYHAENNTYIINISNSYVKNDLSSTNYAISSRIFNYTSNTSSVENNEISSEEEEYLNNIICIESNSTLDCSENNRNTYTSFYTYNSNSYDSFGIWKNQNQTLEYLNITEDNIHTINYNNQLNIVSGVVIKEFNSFYSDIYTIYYEDENELNSCENPHFTIRDLNLNYFVITNNNTDSVCSIQFTINFTNISNPKQNMSCIIELVIRQNSGVYVNTTTIYYNNNALELIYLTNVNLNTINYSIAVTNNNIISLITSNVECAADIISDINNIISCDIFYMLHDILNTCFTDSDDIIAVNVLDSSNLHSQVAVFVVENFTFYNSKSGELNIIPYSTISNNIKFTEITINTITHIRVMITFTIIIKSDNLLDAFNYTNVLRDIMKPVLRNEKLNIADSNVNITVGKNDKNIVVWTSFKSNLSKKNIELNYCLINSLNNNTKVLDYEINAKLISDILLKLVGGDYSGGLE